MAFQNQFLNIQENLNRLIGNINIPVQQPINNPNHFIRLPVNIPLDDQIIVVRLVNFYYKINNYILFIDQDQNRNQLDINIIGQLRDQQNHILDFLNNNNIQFINN